MWQRNPTGEVRHVSAWPTDDDPDRHPFDVGPGEEIDFPELLGGFVALDALPAPAEPEFHPETISVEAPEDTATPVADEEVGEQE